VLEADALVGRRRRAAGRVGAVEVALQVVLAIAGHAVAEDEVVHAAAHVDGVELHVAVVRERGSDVGERRVEPEGAAKEAAGGLGGGGQHGGIRPRWRAARPW